MQDYTISDQVTNQPTQTATTTTQEQNLPQTGINDNMPQLMFGLSASVLLFALLLKIVIKLRGDH